MYAPYSGRYTVCCREREGDREWGIWLCTQSISSATLLHLMTSTVCVIVCLCVCVYVCRSCLLHILPSKMWTHPTIHPLTLHLMRTTPSAHTPPGRANYELTWVCFCIIALANAPIHAGNNSPNDCLEMALSRGYESPLSVTVLLH